MLMLLQECALLLSDGKLVSVQALHVFQHVSAFLVALSA